MQLESLYQEIILDHYRHPHHEGLREPYDAEVRHVNPVCGDEVTLRVTLKDADADPVVADVSYDALGCSISQASASVLTDLLIGKPVSEAMAITTSSSPSCSPRARASRTRTCSATRSRSRGVQVPGPDQVRPAGLDGLEGRDRAGDERRRAQLRRASQTDGPETTADVTQTTERPPAPTPRTCWRRCATWWTPSSASTWWTSGSSTA